MTISEDDLARASETLEPIVEAMLAISKTDTKEEALAAIDRCLPLVHDLPDDGLYTRFLEQLRSAMEAGDTSGCESAFAYLFGQLKLMKEDLVARGGSQVQEGFEAGEAIVRHHVDKLEGNLPS